jgi:hypothetical protein
MLKFLQRAVKNLHAKLAEVQAIPEQQIISSFDDMQFFNRDTDLSAALKKRK